MKVSGQPSKQYSDISCIYVFVVVLLLFWLWYIFLGPLANCTHGVLSLWRRKSLAPVSESCETLASWNTGRIFKLFVVVPLLLLWRKHFCVRTLIFLLLVLQRNESLTPSCVPVSFLFNRLSSDDLNLPERSPSEFSSDIRNLHSFIMLSFISNLLSFLCKRSGSSQQCSCSSVCALTVFCEMLIMTLWLLFELRFKCLQQAAGLMFVSQEGFGVFLPSEKLTLAHSALTPNSFRASVWYPAGVDPGKVRWQVCNNLYATSCLTSDRRYIPELIEISGRLDHCVVDWLSCWKAAEICFTGAQVFAPWGGREGGEEERERERGNREEFVKKKKILSGFCVNEQLWKQHFLLLP